jgi:SAM-dependent methyltransferase
VELLTFLFALPLVPRLLRYGRFGLYGKLDRIAQQAKGPGYPLIMEVLESNLESFNDTLKGLTSDKGLVMSRADIIAWTLQCFENARGRYRGADSSLPSVYRNRYPTYLDSHRRMLERLDERRLLEDAGERIMLATTEPLRHDRVESREVFEQFLAWHEAGDDTDNDIPVPLYCVIPEDAEAIASDFELPTTDVALWERQYALLFAPTEHEDEQRVRMCFSHDNDLYRRCVQYLNALDDKKRTIQEVMNLFPSPMVDAWSQYVNEEKRVDAMARFLPELLAPYEGKRVLDAAAGLGTETEWLLKNGFRDVVSNEIEPQFNARIRDRLNDLKIPYENTLYSYDWREFDRRFPPEIFSVVLLLGNSLCLIKDTDDIRRSLQAFSAVMPSGGILIIDERNWDYFYDHKDELQKAPIASYAAPQAMYYGTEVRSVPIEIVNGDDERKIRLLFYKNGHVEELNAAREKKHYIGEIDMFPILDPSLPQLLKDAGFAVEQRYADLRTSTDSEPTFYTYVARKA